MTATVTPGEFGSGWIAEMPMLPGGAGGYWDLGKNGTVTLHLAQKLQGTFRVKVAQWWDGTVYGGFAEVTTAGATAATSTANIERLGSLGGWVVDETAWTTEGAGADTIVVTAGTTGAVIDSIVVEHAMVAAAAPVLRIRAEGGQVVLSWPVSASGMVLETADSFEGSPEWQAIETQVQVSSETCTVTLPADAAAKFYRLRQP
jgi:hypothetical protein